MSTLNIENILQDQVNNFSLKSPLPANVPVLSEELKQGFRADLIQWYRSNRRMMPWRGDNTDVPLSAYSVWVSEVMLQQTRVETVIEYWNRWLQAFPTVQSLAQATSEEVNRLWAGLGYYRRAQNLLAGAKYVVDKHNGIVPSSKQELLLVPGIGPYTAGAISSIAYSQCEPVVDGNVLRVFSRLFASKLEVGGGKLEKLSWSLAEQLVDPLAPAAFNQAVMELGATICKPTNPSCSTCPVNRYCKAKVLTDFVSSSTTSEILRKVQSCVVDSACSVDVVDIEEIAKGLPKEVTYYPRKVEKKKAKDITLLIHVLRCKSFNGIQNKHYKYLFVRRPAKGLLANQWEFPNIPIQLITDKEQTGEGDSDAEDTAEAMDSSKTNSNTDLLSKYFDDLQSYFQRRCGARWLGLKESCDLDVNASKTTNRVNTKETTASGTTTASILFERVSQPRVVSSPIIHIFSHERHTMHVVVEDVLTICDENESMGNSGSSGCSWMSAEEIVAAGITTGCKKILSEVVEEESVIKVAKSQKVKKSHDASSHNANVIKPVKVSALPSGDIIDLSLDEDQGESEAENTKVDAFAKMKRASFRATKQESGSSTAVKTQRKRKAPA